MADGAALSVRNMEQFLARTRTIPLIAEHDTWITVDPVLGCPADCAYCYLGPLGLRATKPNARATPAMLAAALDDYLRGRRSLVVDPDSDLTPICLGNYTDMIIARSNRRMLVDYLRAIVEVLPTPRPLILITKGAVDAALVADIDTLTWPVYWFFSQSFADFAGVRLEDGPVAKLEITLQNARLIRQSSNQRCAHFWRPFVREFRANCHRADEIVGMLSSAGFTSSVLLGLKRGPGVPLDDHRLRASLATSLGAPGGHQEAFDTEGWRYVRKVAVKLRYPLYRSTSCATALLTGRHESLGTWRDTGQDSLCLSAMCPGAQRDRCRSVRPPIDDLVERIARYLRLEPDRVTCEQGSRRVVIDATIGEYDYNTLAHGLAGACEIRPRHLRREKAWLGAHGEEFQA